MTTSNTPLALEAYLARLDRALASVSVSDRAEIVTEIKSHVLSALERGTSTDVEDVLESLGEPETVANRYLLERGLKPGRASRVPIVKWLVTGFLGTGALILAAIALVIWKFTPIIRVDDKNEHVTILGGLIDIDGKKGSFKVGDLNTQFDEKAQRMSGSKPLDPKKYDSVLVPFSNGRLVVRGAADGVFRWDCRLADAKDQPNLNFTDRAVTLDLSHASLADCELWIPKGVGLRAKGGNGRVKLLRPASLTVVDLGNGVVQIDPDPSLKYRYETRVVNGKSERFESSNDPNAVPIAVSIANGRIEREAGEAYDVND